MLIQEGKFNVVIGGQAGSEAKGKLSAFIAHNTNPPIDIVTMAASPNAGHTYINNAGSKYVSYHLPAAGKVVQMRGGVIALGPTSVINVKIFLKEVLDLSLNIDRIYIDPRATIITDECVAAECGGTFSNIGSTTQGVGVARSRKIGRGHLGPVHFAKDDEMLLDHGARIMEVVPFVNRSLLDGDTILHEMTQGFDLDLEHGIAPAYCTSKMINTSMGMAEMGVPPQWIGEVIGVIRPYPIRVSNRTGYSGSYAEAAEISWEEVRKRCGAPLVDATGAPLSFGEITTTTKLPRRVFEFSWERFRRFVRVCGPTQICLQFANYLDWSIYGKKQDEILWDNHPAVDDFVRKLSGNGGRVTFIGTGPQNDQMWSYALCR